MPEQASLSWAGSPIWAGLADLLSTVVWTGTIVFLAWYYRSEIRALILRVSEIGLTGAKFQTLTQEADNAAGQVSELNRPIPTEPLSDPVMDQYEKQNWNVFEGLKPEEREKKLIRALTIEQMNRTFAIALSDIFGSQIWLLRKMNSRDLPQQEAEMLFASWHAQNPQYIGWNVDQYLNYLLAFRLIEKLGNDYKITNTGRNFLDFLTNFRLREDRPH